MHEGGLLRFFFSNFVVFSFLPWLILLSILGTSGNLKSINFSRRMEQSCIPEDVVDVTATCVDQYSSHSASFRVFVAGVAATTLKYCNSRAVFYIGRFSSWAFTNDALQKKDMNEPAYTVSFLLSFSSLLVLVYSFSHSYFYSWKDEPSPIRIQGHAWCRIWKLFVYLCACRTRFIWKPDIRTMNHNASNRRLHQEGRSRMRNGQSSWLWTNRFRRLSSWLSGEWCIAYWLIPAQFFEFNLRTQILMKFLNLFLGHVSVVRWL